MSLSALRDALALLLRSSSRPSLELDATQWPSPSRSIGDIVQATVKAELVNGRSIIEIDGAPFDVKLPIPARAGDTLRLQVLAAAPRLTLTLLPTNPSASDQVAMSESARRLAAVLDQLTEGAPAAAPRAPGSPLPTNPATDTRTLASTSSTTAERAAPLVTTSAQSSALARETPLTSTLAQSLAAASTANPRAGPAPIGATGTSGTLPQASTSPPLSTGTPASVPLPVPLEAAPLKGAISVGAVSPADTVRFAAALKAAISRSGLFYESHQAQWLAGARPLSELTQEPQAGLSRTAEPVHPQAVGIVREQLEILDTRQLVWLGQVWPDQSMEWRIEEDRKQPGSAPDAARVWNTSLRLTLPRLGTVTALLSIQGDEVRVAFREVSADTRSAIAGEQQALRAAFDLAGLQLLDLKVERHET